jgi:serine O-acetyltransferase
MIDWDWKADLRANAGCSNLYGAVKSFFMVPSFNAVFWIRVMLVFQKKNTKTSRFFSRLISNKLAVKYGIHFSVLIKEIGTGFRLPHPTGIVIGDGTKIGNNVLILQNVTLGKKNLNQKGTPIIGDGVSIMAGAVILGEINIGSNSSIGANSVVLKDVPDNSIAVGAPARVLDIRR